MSEETKYDTLQSVSKSGIWKYFQGRDTVGCLPGISKSGIHRKTAAAGRRFFIWAAGLS